MKYEAGDKVKVREGLEVDEKYGNYKFEEEMEKYKGKQAIIDYVYGDAYDLDIDDGEYAWTDEMLEALTHMPNKFKGYPIAETIAESNEFTKEDLKFGDIVTLRNEDKYICINEKIINEKNYKFCIETYNEDFTYGDEITKIPELDIMKVQRIDPTFIGECFNLEDDKTKIRAIETLYERKEILTEEEKEWLKNVISGFKTKIEYIKADHFNKWINIRVEKGLYTIDYAEDLNYDFTNMAHLKPYTLEELGL